MNLFKAWALSQIEKGVKQEGLSEDHPDFTEAEKFFNFLPRILPWIQPQPLEPV